MSLKSLDLSHSHGNTSIVIWTPYSLDCLVLFLCLFTLHFFPCFSGYLLHYILAYSGSNGFFTNLVGFSIVCLVVGLIGLGRIYLGMHSLIDIVGGLVMGLGILAMWLSVSEYIDNFIVAGQNVVSFWTTLSFLLLFAYPTPALLTPSYEFHTAYNGVALGIVIVVHQTFHELHNENVALILSPELTIFAFAGRMLLGIPTFLFVKFCSKALATWILPILATTLGIPVKSMSYIPALNGGTASDKKSDEIKQPGYVQKLFFFSKQTSFDVDTGIRLLQYAGLAWSVVDLVPSLFSHVGL